MMCRLKSQPTFGAWRCGGIWKIVSPLRKFGKVNWLKLRFYCSAISVKLKPQMTAVLQLRIALKSADI